MTADREVGDAVPPHVSQVQGMVQANPCALSDLYDRHADILFSLIVRILGKGPEAEEALMRPLHEVPDQTAEASERREHVVRALATLPARSRQPLELAFFGGRSYSEIAKEMNQPLGTVKSWTRCKLTSLRDDLGILGEGGAE